MVNNYFFLYMLYLLDHLGQLDQHFSLSRTRTHADVFEYLAGPAGPLFIFE